jgi:hypothetical protein
MEKVTHEIVQGYIQNAETIAKDKKKNYKNNR